MDISTIQVKITNIDTASNTLSVIWASDQSQRHIDEYTTFVVSLDQLPQETASTSQVLEHLAILGIQECQKQCREENSQLGMLITELAQEIGVVNTFNLNTLLPPALNQMPLMPIISDPASAIPDPDAPVPDLPFGST
jgi:hypothetical protein